MISMPGLLIFAQAFPGILVGFVNFPAGCIVVKLTIKNSAFSGRNRKEQGGTGRNRTWLLLIFRRCTSRN